MQPPNYTAQFQNPLVAFTEGVSTVDALRQRAAQAQAQQTAVAGQQALQADVAAIYRDGRTPSSVEFAQLATKYPALQKTLQPIWDKLSGDQKAARVGAISNVYAALSAGSVDTAKQILEEDALAAENSGNADLAKQARALSKIVDLNPETARTSVGLRLASLMGPDKFSETFSKLEADRREGDREGAALTEAQAKARKAAVDAQFAESNAVADLQKKGWDVYKIQEDTAISRENSRIAALNAEINRTSNELKREELGVKLEEMKRKRDETVNTKAANLEAARGNVDNMLNTLDRILQTPAGVVQSATGPISSKVPTLSSDVADFEEMVSTIDAQSFLAQVPNLVGMGALSDAEGRKIAAAFQNFSLRQSSSQLLANAREAQRLLVKMRKNIAAKYGVPESIPDTPAAEPTPDDVEALLKQYGG